MDFETSEMDQGLAAPRQRHDEWINRENGASSEKINWTESFMRWIK